MIIIKILLLGILGAFFSLILKEQKQPLGVLVSVLTACTVLFLILPELEKIISYAKALYNASGGKDMYIDSVFKITAIAFLAWLGSDILKESGLLAASNIIIMAGKVMCLLICLPVVSELFNIILAILP